MVKAIALAFQWRKLQESGTHATIAETVVPSRRGAAERASRNNVSARPPDLYAEHAARGEADLLVWLRDLPVSTLRSLIRTNDFDPMHRTSKWREAEKLATFIVDSLRSRMTRGSAFMSKG
jgi:hypothetical protein